MSRTDGQKDEWVDIWFISDLELEITQKTYNIVLVERSGIASSIALVSFNVLEVIYKSL